MNITDQEIAALTAANSEHEWNATCATIKAARGGAFPPDWWPRVMSSGLAKRTAAKWGGTDEIQVTGI